MIHRQTFVEQKLLGSPRGFGESRTLALLNPSEFHHLASFLLIIKTCMRANFTSKHGNGSMITRDIITSKTHMHANFTSHHKLEIIASFLLILKA